jgi:methylmalonyl-CoA/ethylmalonyl-CoA epimerase
MESLRIHHIGVAVPEIGSHCAMYVKRFGYVVRTEVIHDPMQTAYVQFLRLPGDSVYLEFVAPDGPNSKLANAVNKGGGLNHVCYSTPDIEATCQELRKTGLVLLQKPVEATAFHPRRIAWLMGTDGVPVELVELGQEGEL